MAEQADTGSSLGGGVLDLIRELIGKGNTEKATAPQTQQPHVVIVAPQAQGAKPEGEQKKELAPGGSVGGSPAVEGAMPLQPQPGDFKPLAQVVPTTPAVVPPTTLQVNMGSLDLASDMNSQMAQQNKQTQSAKSSSKSSGGGLVGGLQTIAKVAEFFGG